MRNVGDGFGIAEGRENDPNDAWMIVQNMLPAPDFTQAIQNTSVSGEEAALSEMRQPGISLWRRRKGRDRLSRDS